MKVLNLPGPIAKSYIERDQKVISPSYPRGYPFVMDHGRGTEVWDVDGNRFLDFAAGIAVTSTGHSHPRVVKASRNRLKVYSHLVRFLSSQLGRSSRISGSYRAFSRGSISFMTNSGLRALKLQSSWPLFNGSFSIYWFSGRIPGRNMGA